MRKRPFDSLPEDDQQQARKAAALLAQAFAGTVAPETVDRCVAGGSTGPDLEAARAARDEIREQVEGLASSLGVLLR